MEILQPAGWQRPRGYSHGVGARGRIVAVSGQVGWNPATGEFERDDFIGQADQALRNIVAVLRSGGAEPKDLVRLTWYIINRSDYLAAQKPLGQAYREIIGSHYPAMSVVIVNGLLEVRALLEIEALAVVAE